MKDHQIHLFYSDEDGGYFADVPALDSCSAFGESPEEAVTEVITAKEAWLAVARETGKKENPPG